LRVAVLGSSGGMGGFFVRYFISEGAQVSGHDSRRGSFRNPRFRFARSNSEAVSGADVVVVATPIERTVETVEEVAPALSSGSTVVEITSVKGRVLGALRPLVRERGAKLLSLHPLFGPSLKSRGEMKFCVIETEKGSLERAMSLFPDATLIPMKAREHDRLMGIILSLTHLVNIAYAGAVSRYLRPKEFRRIQTPTSAVQLTLAEGVLSQSPSLYSYIQLQNEHSSEFARVLIEELESLKLLVDRGDRSGFEKRFSEISEFYAGDSKAALDLVYQAFETSSR
jgi:prephenate dehydrogenase